MKRNGTPTEPAPLQTYDREAEEGALGTLLFDPGTWSKIGWLSPADFQNEVHRAIFQAIVQLQESVGGFDMLTVCDHLKETGQMELVDGAAMVGGSAYVLNLVNAIPSGSYGDFYAKKVRKARRLQALRQVVERGAALVGSPNGADPVASVQSLLAAVEEDFPDPETARVERYSTMADLDAVLGPITWDWPGWLARGFATLIAAEPGVGKSMLALRIAATYLLGWAWPDGTPYTGEKGRILWCETEAGQAVNRERAKSWGLPTERIVYPLANPLDTVNLEDPRHLESIRRLATYDDMQLIVVDSFSGGHAKDENDALAGQVVKRLSEIARDVDVPLLLTHHLNKSWRSNRISLVNVRGSTAIAQHVRLVWAMDKPDPDDEKALRVYAIKSNLAELPAEIGLAIRGNGLTGLPAAPKPPKGDTIEDRAMDFLAVLLEREPLPTKEVESAFEEAGLSLAALRRARSRLNVLSIRKPTGAYMLSLPARDVDKIVN